MNKSIIFILVSIVVILVLALQPGPRIPDAFMRDVNRVTTTANECYENVSAGPDSVDDMLPCRRMIIMFDALERDAEALPDYMQAGHEQTQAAKNMAASIKRAMIEIKLANSR